MYRNLAPIDKAVWNEVDKRAKEVLLSRLSARKAVHVEGPKGSDVVAYNHGRLGETKKSNGVVYANYEVSTLVESRVQFKLRRWDMDNYQRGDKNIDFSELEKAVIESALFEERAIYNGLPEAGIRGIANAGSEVISLGDSALSVKSAVAGAVIKLRNAFVSGAMDLIVSEELYSKLWSYDNARPLVTELEKLIGGKVITSSVVEGAVLLPHDDDNLVLYLGQDFTLDYQEHNDQTVTFFIKESFTFQILDENLIVRFK